MATRTRLEQKLYEIVAEFAYDPDPLLVQKYEALHDHRDHDLVGPILQYKTDNYNLGRHIVLCHGDHPGDPENPKALHKPVSQALTTKQRTTIRERRIAEGIAADGKPLLSAAIETTISARTSAQKRKKVDEPALIETTTSARRNAKKRNKKVAVSSDTIDLTIRSTPPLTPAPARQPPTPPARASNFIDLTSPPSTTLPPARTPLTRVPSIEFIRRVPAPQPVLFDEIHILYYYEDDRPPRTFVLKALAARQEFRLRQHEEFLQSQEIKQTDLVTVLTTAIDGVRTWSSFRVSNLMIPRTQSKLVLSRPRVQKPHPSIDFYDDYAYPGAAELDGRILPLP